METKISKIEAFLETIEKSKLDKQQSSYLIGAAGPPGGGPAGPEGDKNKNCTQGGCNSMQCSCTVNIPC